MATTRTASAVDKDILFARYLVGGFNKTEASRMEEALDGCPIPGRSRGLSNDQCLSHDAYAQPIAAACS